MTNLPSCVHEQALAHMRQGSKVTYNVHWSGILTQDNVLLLQ